LRLGLPYAEALHDGEYGLVGEGGGHGFAGLDDDFRREGRFVEGFADEAGQIGGYRSVWLASTSFPCIKFIVLPSFSRLGRDEILCEKLSSSGGAGFDFMESGTTEQLKIRGGIAAATGGALVQNRKVVGHDAVQGHAAHER